MTLVRDKLGGEPIWAKTRSKYFAAGAAKYFERATLTHIIMKKDISNIIK
jgi:hypothetical protein